MRPRSRVRVRPVAAAVALAVCSALADDSRPLTVAGGTLTDGELVRRVALMLEPDDIGLDDWMSALRVEIPISGPDPKGFGGRAYYADAHSHYTRVSFMAVTYEGKIASILITTDFDEVTPDIIFEEVERIWAQHDVFAENRVFYYEYEDDDVIAAYRKNVNAGFAPLPRIAIPERLADDYHGLTSPVSDLYFGDYCDELELWMPGREAAARLARDKRWDLLRRVLRNVNPEGRIYAAEALMSGDANEVDLEFIDKLRRSPVLINACNGCDCGQATAASLLPLPTEKRPTSPEADRLITHVVERERVSPAGSPR